ncbi:MAG: hypothetical protein LRZ88_12725 [Candidatus Cloacimonetes bacterium]|nr:hypothetical protein [Candidatus Cloacimonadota bacterium]
MPKIDEIKKLANAPKKGTKEYQKPQAAVRIDDAVLRPQALVSDKTNAIVAWIIFALTLVVYITRSAHHELLG